jgi:threonine dehydrogenase-like Zn-dependent dehydrogenase
MKTALLYAPKKIGLGDTPTPKAGPGQVLIRPIMGGICGTDVHIYLGHRAVASYPHALGHEIVGRVEALGAGVTKLAVGQRVVVEPNYPCGECSFCRTGRGCICPNKRSPGVSVPGFFAETCVAEAEFTWPIPDGISDEDAATIEPLAVSMHALLHSGAKVGDTVAVVGLGATGLLLVEAAVAQGVRVLAHTRSESKLALARSMGAETPKADDMAALWKAENVSVVFECAGAIETVEQALNCAPRGSLVSLIGLSSEPAKMVPLRIVREGIRIEGSLIYDHPGDFSRVISLVSRGVLHPSRIVTTSLPFADLVRGFETASAGGSIKVLLKF